MYADKLLLLGKATVQNCYAYHCWKNWPPTQTLIKRTVKCILQQEETEQRKMQQGWGMKEPMANSVADELPGNLLTLETINHVKTSIWRCLHNAINNKSGQSRLGIVHIYTYMYIKIRKSTQSI